MQSRGRSTEQMLFFGNRKILSPKKCDPPGCDLALGEKVACAFVWETDFWKTYQKRKIMLDNKVRKC